MIHGEREGKESSRVGGPGKRLRQHLSASVSVTAQPLRAWEAARAGEMEGLQELG